MRRVALVLLCLGGVGFGDRALALKEFYEIARSERAMGMGGAIYALSDDEYALFYNPAGVALYGGPSQFMISFGGEVGNDTISGLNTIRSAFNSNNVADIAGQLESLDGKPLYAGANVFPFFITRGFAIGLLAANAKADVAILGSQLASDLDVTAIVDSGLFITKAFTLAPNFYFGVTGKAVYRAGVRELFTVLDMATSKGLNFNDALGRGLGIDGDLGFTYVIGRPSSKVTGGVSLSFNNLAATDFPIGRVDSPPQLPRMGSAGGFVIIKGGKVIDNLRFLLDLAEFNLGGQTDEDLGQRSGRFFKHVNLGTEIPLGHWLALRGGLHQGDWTAGLGLRLKVIKLDLVSYSEELDHDVGRLASRRYGLQLGIGFGAPNSDAVGTGKRSRE